jgi:hypothetical protein
MLTWLTGLAAVWLLRCPASSAFFRRCRQAALPGNSELNDLRRASAALIVSQGRHVMPL